jgi:hypothetical protein
MELEDVRWRKDVEAFEVQKYRVIPKFIRNTITNTALCPTIPSTYSGCLFREWRIKRACKTREQYSGKIFNFSHRRTWLCQNY